ncbi:RDD family protein [Haladaptatus salinisoli]|uniref:RDD family protein n=1 Tax=Haladaptatus salinisoli TaxID=2884876 RepID=UPI001D0A8A26|nr:RDD family protein [Haladaptatus salinisoli]
MVEPVIETEQDVILSRVAAFVVDHVISFVAGVALGVALGLSLGRAGIFLGVFSGMFGYFIVLEGLFGQTFGKRLLGIVVVKRSGDPCTMGASLVRNLLRIIDGILSYAVALVVMLTNDDRQRIGDVAADTVVVRAR